MRTVMIAMLASTVLSLPAKAQQPNQSRTSEAANDQIKPIQSAQNQKGFKAGPQDGKLGRQTEAVLRNFQRQQHAPVTGKLDNQTLPH